MYVEDIMHKGDEIPYIQNDAPLSEALVEMSSKGLGMTGIVDEQQNLVGIFTDGDLRRTFASQTSIDTVISEVMTAKPITVKPDVLAAELVTMMKKNSISSILVTDNKKIIGALNMQDLLRAGVL